MVLIDVDGTLVDSVPDLAFCVDEMMKQLDMPIRGDKRVRHWVGVLFLTDYFTNVLVH